MNSQKQEEFFSVKGYINHISTFTFTIYHSESKREDDTQKGCVGRFSEKWL